MKRIAYITLIGLIVVGGAVTAGEVTTVGLEHENGATVAKIHVDGPVRFMHQTEVAKNGKPFRIIVDVLAAEHGLSSSQYTNLPKSQVTAVRSSQYAVSPEKICRIVFDMNGPTMYSIDKQDNTIVVKFKGEVEPFAAWQSPAPQPKPAEKPAVASADEPVAKDANKAIETDRQASLAPAKPKVKKPEQPKETFGPVIDPGLLAIDDEPAKVSTPESAPAKKAEPTVTAKPEPAKAEPAPKKPAADDQKALASKLDKPSKANTKPKATDAKQGDAKPATAKSEPPKQSEKSTVAKKPADKKQNSTATSTKKTSRFRRTPAEIQGTMVAEFPKRLVIKYRPRLNRDPFKSLVRQEMDYDGPIGERIPNVEGLKLVGVITADVESNRALLEDKNGFSYILKAGDKVRSGYVLRVDDDRVFFQIFEYGWSRTVGLALENQ